jgi:transposase IS66-like protein
MPRSHFERGDVSSGAEIREWWQPYFDGATYYTLIETAKLSDVDPQAWLTDLLARLQDHPAKRIAELLPWNWKRERRQKVAA